MPSDHAPPIILLDTHVWLWTVESDAHRIARDTVRVIERASRTGIVYVSAASLREVAALAARRRVTLAQDPLGWMTHALQAPGVRLVPITPEIAVESTRLPGVPHKDPIDQLLMATSRHLGATLVTCDGLILKYVAATGALATLDARP